MDNGRGWQTDIFATWYPDFSRSSECPECGEDDVYTWYRDNSDGEWVAKQNCCNSCNWMDEEIKKKGDNKNGI